MPPELWPAPMRWNPAVGVCIWKHARQAGPKSLGAPGGRSGAGARGAALHIRGGLQAASWGRRRRAVDSASQFASAAERRVALSKRPQSSMRGESRAPAEISALWLCGARAPETERIAAALRLLIAASEHARGRWPRIFGNPAGARIICPAEQAPPGALVKAAEAAGCALSIIDGPADLLLAQCDLAIVELAGGFVARGASSGADRSGGG